MTGILDQDYGVICIIYNHFGKQQLWPTGINGNKKKRDGVKI